MRPNSKNVVFARSCLNKVRETTILYTDAVTGKRVEISAKQSSPGGRIYYTPVKNTG